MQVVKVQFDLVINFVLHLKRGENDSDKLAVHDNPREKWGDSEYVLALKPIAARHVSLF